MVNNLTAVVNHVTGKSCEWIQGPYPQKPMVKNFTPIERYVIEGKDFFVKREDLAAKYPFPPFSKVRGLIRVLRHLKKSSRVRGVKKEKLVIGYVETSISMAGVGVAVGCRELGVPCVIYNPIYKENTNKTLIYHRKVWGRTGASIIDIKAGRAKVNYYICKKKLREDYGKGAIMLPLGLPFEETIEETEKEVKRDHIWYKTVVVNVGSGTICAGVLRGLRDHNVNVYGIMGRTGSVSRKRNQILCMAQVVKSGLLFEGGKFFLIDPGYEYTEEASFLCPFPCNGFYDMKALRWLLDNFESLKKPVLFWNIGAEINESFLEEIK